jgi:hypothetical protein
MDWFPDRVSPAAAWPLALGIFGNVIFQQMRDFTLGEAPDQLAV